MPCLLVLVALFLPRVAIVILALFTTYMSNAYHTLLWPVLGFIFLPYTTLAYAWAINSHGSVDGIYLAVVVIAALVDLGTTGGGARVRKTRVVRVEQVR
jgi:TRAP-type mannitol/chloroaromatic compound transport system permease small subunit